MSKLVSIIIPVYNVEKYIRKCADSVLAQDYDNIEVILIDDGSTDASGTICDEYAKSDSHVRVIHKVNGGLMSAWLCGLDASVGEYTAFVDSDDWVDSDMISVLMANAEKSGADITLCTLVKECADGTSEREHLLFEPGVYNKSDIQKKIFPIMISSGTWPARGLSPSRVTKLFKHDLLIKNRGRYDAEVTIGEDLLTSFVNIMTADSLCIIGDFFPYHYRMNSSSMTNCYSHGRYEKIHRLHEDLIAADRAFYNCFESQFSDDYIYLMLQQIEGEILYSGLDDKRIISDIKAEYNSRFFKNAIKNCSSLKLTKKSRLYLFMMRHRLFSLMIHFRRFTARS